MVSVAGALGIQNHTGLTMGTANDRGLKCDPCTYDRHIEAGSPHKLRSHAGAVAMIDQEIAFMTF